MTRERLIVTLAVLCALGAPALADDKAGAEAAFLRGKELMKAGHIAEACDAFARSEQLDSQLGTRYNLAICYEKQGRIASAWALFRELAQRDSNAARKKDSTARAQALAPRLTKMLINLEFAAVPGLVVTRNGADVTATVGIETPVDPGQYEIVATAPGFESFSARVSATGPGMTVTVAIPSLDKAPKTAQPRPANGASDAADEDEDEPLVFRDDGAGRRRLGVGGSGLAVGAGGVVFGVLASSKWSKAKDLCGDDLRCDTQGDLERGNGLVSDARTYGNVSTVLVGVGAAAVVTGVVLWLTAPSGETPDEHAWLLTPSVDRDGVYVSIGGAL